MPKPPAGRRWTVAEDGAGSRLDVWLAGRPEVRSRRRARAWLARGKVFLNEREASGADAAHVLAPGDRIDVWADRPGSASRPPRGLAAARGQLRVVFEDATVLVADKPAGLLVEPLPPAPRARRGGSPAAARRGTGTEVTLLELVRDYVRFDPARSPRVVHRIDRDSSGLVVFALTLEAWVHLKRQFARRTAERVYVAIVEGCPLEARGTWRDTLAWNAERLRQRTASPDDPRGRDAQASYEVREAFRGAALLDVRLVTGKRNQIRIQAGLRGHPLVGEKIYRLRGQAPTLTFGRQALHAARLSFLHPATGQPVRVTAPLPADLRSLLGRLRERTS